MSTLLRGNRAQRAGRNSKRGGRGTGAGAEDSSPASSKFKVHLDDPNPLAARFAAAKRGDGRAPKPKNNNLKIQKKSSKKRTADSNFANTTTEADPFREERLRNAARRENSKGTVNGDAKKNGGRFVNKQVRFTSPLSQGSASPGTSRDSSSEPQAPARGLSTAPSVFSKLNGNSGKSSHSPMANQSNASKTSSPFGAPSVPKFGSSTTSGFGTPSNENSNPFSKATSSQPTTNGFSSFGSSSTMSPGTGFGSNAFPASKPQAPTSTPKFGAPSTAPSTNFSGGFGNQSKSTTSSSAFGSNAFGAQPNKPQVSGSMTSKSLPKPNGVKFPSGKSQPSNGAPKSFGGKPQASIPNGIPTVSSSKWASDMEKILLKEGIAPPSWPMKTPGDPAQKGAVEGHWRSYKGYRAKARACLIKNNCIDDPDKPKKLSEAIDFKGTCEEMCPEFEKISRIMENDVKGPEKQLIPGQSTPWPAPNKMVKALSRSAAGQDAPLPEDVRSPAALRRTLDYLMDTILTEDGLSEVHGFLWDRTRAIRRDFTFQAQSMTTPEELLDQVYCLEQITRFHVIALHQMSPRRLGEKITEDFSEQQEVEQLGKALLSLTHAYEDCKGYDVKCENEAEFRSYYVVFNAHYPGIMETVQDWGWEFWGESDQIRTAVSIVEALQNTWDNHGPLKPESPAVTAQNAYSKFFSMIEDPNISYTMACFAEIHFNLVRKSALKTIVSSYRKQRDQTKEWTLRALNEILMFDEEEEVEKFCEAYQLTIQGSGEDELYLSLEEEYAMDDPFPKLSQLHSSIVERKRGNRSLQDAIHQTIFEEVEDDDSMFVQDTRSRPESDSAQVQKSPAPVEQNAFNWGSVIPGQGNLATPALTGNATTSWPAPPPAAQTPPIFQVPQPPGNSSVFNFGSPAPQEIQPTSVLNPNNTSSKPLETKAPAFNFFEKQSSSTSPAAFSPPTLSQKQPEASAPDSATQTSLAAAQIPNTASSSPFTFTQPVTSESTSTPFKLPDFGSLPSTQPTPKPLFPSVAASPPSFGLQPPLPANPFFNAPAKATVSSTMTPSQLPAPAQLPVPAPQPPLPSLESRLPAFAEWFANGVDGIVPQFVEFEVEKILLQAVAQYEDEEKARQIQEEDDRAREEADEFRKRSLATRYCHIWRENAHALWRRRQAIEHRKMRAERMEEMKAAREAAKAVDIVAEFTATTKRKRLGDSETTSSKRRSSEDKLRATGIFDFVHDPNEEIRNVVRTDNAPIRAERSESPLEIPPANSSHRGMALEHSSRQLSKSQSSMRTSLLSDPSYLHGGSRSFLLPSGATGLHESKRRNNVKTDYFRMKARGILTLPNGSPIPHFLKKRRSFDGISKNVTPKRSIRRPEARSVPAKTNGHVPDESDDELAQLKERAKNLMSGGNEQPAPNNKRPYDYDDEELFAKAKRIREQMDEGADWFRKELRRESARRSGS